MGNSNNINPKYEKLVNKILKTYNSIMVKCRNIPILPDKNIIIVDDINSMINTQIETRKPILYYQEENSTTFMILDQEEVYVYMLKKIYDVEGKVEVVIKSMDSTKNGLYGDVFAQGDRILSGEQSTALVPVKKKSIFSFLFKKKKEKQPKVQPVEKAQEKIGTPVSYAVQIYGINEDEDANGNPIGLTFGPATGDDYNNRYITHEYEEASSGMYNVKIVTHIVEADGTETTTSEYLYKNGGTTDKVTRTEEEKNKYDINIREMTWEQISAVPDKTVFTDCMLCGDTKKVELSINDAIGSGVTFNQHGDGAGILYGAIKPYYRMWNPAYSNTDATRNNPAVGKGITLDANEQQNGSNARSAGGYSTSHLRATLIGENAKTNASYAGDRNVSEEDSLYSCLPTDLKKAIKPKKILYVTGESNSIYHLNEDIVDNIWAFSQRELYGTGQFTGGTSEGLGVDGHGYSKFSSPDSKYYIKSYNNHSLTQRKYYNESNMVDYGWLRSPSLSGTHYSRRIYTGSLNNYGRACNDDGLSFGFCIK